MQVNNLEQIMNKYISNELKDEALFQFEELLSTNPQLAKEVALYKKIDQTLTSKKSIKNKEELKPLFQQFGEKYIINPVEKETPTKIVELNKGETPNTKKTEKGMLRWLAPVIGVAAAALLVFFIGFGEASPEQLAQQYFEPYSTDFTLRNGEANTLSSAQQAFENLDYEKAKTLFSLVAESEQAQMAIGNCEYLMNKPKKAAVTFEKIVNSTTNQVIKTQANWYLGLSYLKLANETQAKESLLLIESTSNYYKDAQAILKELD